MSTNPNSGGGLEEEVKLKSGKNEGFVDDSRCAELMNEKDPWPFYKVCLRVCAHVYVCIYIYIYVYVYVYLYVYVYVYVYTHSQSQNEDFVDDSRCAELMNEKDPWPFYKVCLRV
jgi:hypothetical protein